MLNTVKSRYSSGKAIKLIILTFVLFSLLTGISRAQWVQFSNGMGNVTVTALSVSGTYIFAGTSGNNGVYISTNNGINWTQTSLNKINVRSLAINGSYIFAGTDTNGVYLSTDNGTTWAQTTLNNRSVYSLAVSGNYILAGTGPVTAGYGIYVSTDNGTSWTQTSLNNICVLALKVVGNIIYAGTYYSGVKISTDNGTTWTQTSLNSPSIWSFAVNGSTVFAGANSGQGVYLSTNNGTSWTQSSLNNQYMFSLAASGNNIFAGSGAFTYSFYQSTDNGASWIQRNEGFPALTVWSITILNNNIFIGTGQGVWRRPLGELTGTQVVSSEVPNRFSLSQNYPNPFNPTTRIKFALPSGTFAKLVVYDALGREVETLVNEQLNAGTYEVNWDASNYPSGVYLYKLICTLFSQTNKMILIK